MYNKADGKASRRMTVNKREDHRDCGRVPSLAEGLLTERSIFMKKRSFRRLAAVVLAIAVALTVLPVAWAEFLEQEAFGVTEAVLEKQTVPYVRDFGGEAPERGEAALYFLKGGDIPYVALTEYLQLLSETLERHSHREGITYEVSQFAPNYYRVRRPDVEAEMWINTQSNTIEFDNFNGFTQKAEVVASVTMLDLPEPKEREVDVDALLEEFAKLPEEEQAAFLMANLGNAHEPESLFATAAETINRGGEPILLEMDEYLIDLVEQEGECYLPLQTMNDLFMSPQNLYVIYNGKALYCIPYQSDLMEEVYEAEPSGKMSFDFALFNYNELRFLLDCCYGLKEEHAIDSFATLLAHNTNLVSELVSTDPAVFDSAVARLTLTYLDDGHSAFLRPSWRSDPAKSESMSVLSYMGYALNRQRENSTRYSEARQAAFPDGVPMYQEVGDTAFVTFDSFMSDDDFSVYYHMDEPAAEEFVIRETSEMEEMEDIGEEEVPPAVIRLLVYARKQILRENSPIRNVVVDLSNNDGGNSNAAVFTLAWMLGEADIAIRDTFTGAETIMRLSADLELTENYDTAMRGLADQDLGVYCLISPNSFSCGNLVPAACKMDGRVTLLGRTSGGGSCAVYPCTSASGTVMQISGPMQLSTIRNGSYYNIDQGIEPDVVLTRVETFYDRERLVEIIHGLD